MTADAYAELEIHRLRTAIAIQREVTAAASDRDAVLRLVAERALAVLPTGDGAVVELVDGTLMEYVAVTGTLAGFAGMRLPVSGSLSGVVISSGATIRCEDVEADPRVDLAACHKVGIGSMIIAPLFAAGVPIGVLKVSSRAAHAFSVGDEQQLTLLADALAGALRHADDTARNAALLAQTQETVAALQASEARFRMAFDSSPLGMVLVGLQPHDLGTYLQANPAMAAITGYPVTRLVGMSGRDLHHPDDMQATEHTLEQLRQGEVDLLTAQRRYRHADGHLVWVKIHAALVRDGAGLPLYAVNQVEDVTARRLISEQLRERAQLLDLTQDAVMVRDLHGRITYWNPAAERIYGWPSSVAAGQDQDQLLSTSWPPGTDRASITQALLTGGTWAGELEHRRADGRPVIVHSRKALQRDSDGRPVALLSINTDVTARRAAEQERDAAMADLADRNRRLEAANQLKLDLIGMLGHEISNPLVAILGYTEMLIEDAATMEPAEREARLATINKHARRLDDIVREVLTMVTLDAGQMTATPEPVRLCQHLEGILAGRPLAELELRCPPEVVVAVQPGHLDHIVTNLLSNAGKYGGGASRIAAVRDGGQVRISVEDRGPGVPEEFRASLFERFTRAGGTANAVKGTGLGLYIVRELARANGGDVAHHPTPGGGATFTVTLPGG